MLGLATLLFIGWQAWETRKAAEAAAASARATRDQLLIQTESLRPRLNISNFVNNAYSEARNGERVCVSLKISNSGGMPAYNVITETWIEFIQRGSMERPYQFSPDAKYHKSAPINVDTGSPQGFEIPFNRRLSSDESARMGRGEGTVCFRIRLTYHAFENAVHFEHAYAMRPDAMESIAEYTSAN